MMTAQCLAIIYIYTVHSSNSCVSCTANHFPLPNKIAVSTDVSASTEAVSALLFEITDST